MISKVPDFQFQSTHWSVHAYTKTRLEGRRQTYRSVVRVFNNKMYEERCSRNKFERTKSRIELLTGIR